MKTENVISFTSPGGRVRAEFAIETVWDGSTVYPDAPVWRVWFGDRPVIDTSLLGLRTAQGKTLQYGMTRLRATRRSTQTSIGEGRELHLKLQTQDATELHVRLRLTDMSALCEATQPRKNKQDGKALTRIKPLKNSVPLCKTPAVFYAPSGKLVAYWQHGLSTHIVFFDRPGDLAVRSFNVFPEIPSLHIEDGTQGCSHLFLTVPFTKSKLPDPTFGDTLTPAFKIAFCALLQRGETADDFWFVRGEPGKFAVAAERRGKTWRVYAITSQARTLTVRLEDFWLRMPENLRAPRYVVTIRRDPNKNETGQALIEETFTKQLPDVRILLDLAKYGGFVLTFTPHSHSN